MSNVSVPSMGVVVIGRNEGERLHRCLRSVVAAAMTVVYVDSGSTDESIAFARQMGVDVVALDLSCPFTAARARNTGCERLLEIEPNTEFVFFIDGDCEMQPNFLAAAMVILLSKPELAIVAGRLSERFPEASIYNRLCDLEWDTPPGDVNEVGGNIVVRVAAFHSVGGFNGAIVAGEEPDLCFRLRHAGWRILRIGSEMAWHDAAMTRFSQWWKRSIRSGHGYAEGADRRGNTPERHWLRETRSNSFWGIGFPAVVLAVAWRTSSWALLGFAAYPLMVLKVALRRHRSFGDSVRHSLIYGIFVMLGKLPFALGQVSYGLQSARDRRTQLDEPKSSDSVHSPPISANDANARL